MMDEYTKILKKYYPIVKCGEEVYLFHNGWYVYKFNWDCEYIDPPPPNMTPDEFEAIIVLGLL